MILSQTKLFNIFPSAVQLGNMSKILTNNCDRETLKYIPKRECGLISFILKLLTEKTILV